MLIAENQYQRSYTMQNAKLQLEELKLLCHQHPLWSNPLLLACEEGTLKFADFQYLFSQYYLYSKNFSRFLAGAMANCEDDYYRSKLTENLWEESGEQDLEKRHAEIFRKFLIEQLHLILNKIEFEDFTRNFVAQYMAVCLEMPALESTAALSLGTEGIVSTLYSKFKRGLLVAGFKDEALRFFNIHIECDDAHAATLEEMVLSYVDERGWLERCKAAMLKALDLRNEFFHHIYKNILQRNMQPLINSTAYKPHKKPAIPNNEALVSDTAFNNNLLYANNHAEDQIHFSVQRVPFDAEVLDPRLVVIPAGFKNEYHEHAHETVFLILEGEGEVIIEDRIIPVKKDSIVYVPRWLKHQTCNKGNGDLKFFAITDYKLTGRFPMNSESIYRKKRENVHATTANTN